MDKSMFVGALGKKDTLIKNTNKVKDEKGNTLKGCQYVQISAYLRKDQLKALREVEIERMRENRPKRESSIPAIIRDAVDCYLKSR